MTSYPTKVLWGPLAHYPIPGCDGAAYTAHALNDANNAVAMIFIAPKAGVIDRIGVNVTAKVGVSPEYNVGLTTSVSGTTPFGGSAIKSHDFSATGIVWVTLPTPATVAAGDHIVAKIYPGTTAPDATHYISVGYRDVADFTLTGWTLYLFAVAWTPYPFGVSLGVQYQSPDDTIVLPMITDVRKYMNTTTTPDEYGNLFTLPIDAICSGIVINPYLDGIGDDFTLTLYDAANNVLRQTTFDVSDMQTTTSLSRFFAVWEPITLTKNTQYRVTIKPTTSSNMAAPVFTFSDAANRAGWPCGDTWQGTHRADAGAWTNDPLTLTMMALYLTSIN